MRIGERPLLSLPIDDSVVRVKCVCHVASFLIPPLLEMTMGEFRMPSIPLPPSPCHCTLAFHVNIFPSKGDADNDGKLTLSEYLASPMGKFAAGAAVLDGGVDGLMETGGSPNSTLAKTSVDGLQTARAEFKRMDRDGNGVISKAEFDWYVNPNDFESADRDGNGLLDEREFLSAPFHWHEYQETSEKKLKAEFMRFDKDQDSKISLEEYNEELEVAKREDMERNERDAHSRENEDMWQD